MKKIESEIIDCLNKKNVKINDLTELVFEIQSKYTPSVTLKECKKAIYSVLENNEACHAILTGLLIDDFINANYQSDTTIINIIKNDNFSYGVDETIALGIVNLYGSIAWTNFGYLDKNKPGIIGIVDRQGKNSNLCTTFLDDILAAIVASSCSIIAHNCG